MWSTWKTLPNIPISASVRSGAAPDRGPVVVDYCFPQTGPGSPYRAVLGGRWKYVGFRDLPEILYDLGTAPAETENLAAGDPEGEAAAALERLRGFVDRTMDFEAYDPDAIRERFFENGFVVPEEHPPDVPGHSAAAGRSSGNGYLLDGRVVADDPAATFDDWPGG